MKKVNVIVWDCLAASRNEEGGILVRSKGVQQREEFN